MWRGLLKRSVIFERNVEGRHQVGHRKVTQEIYVAWKCPSADRIRACEQNLMLFRSPDSNV
jgi:hypothetical protein